MHAHTARFLPERDARMYARMYVRDRSGLCITSHLLFVSRFQSLWLLSHTGCVRAALRSFSLRKGVTVARGEEANSQRERELCYFSLFSDIVAEEIRDFFTSDLRIHWSTGRLRTLNCWETPRFSDIVVRLDFLDASEHASFNSLHSTSNCCSPAIKSDFTELKSIFKY